MPRYLVPVFYTMAGDLRVEADDQADAIRAARKMRAGIDDLQGTSYCDGSWEVADDPDTVREVVPPEVVYRLMWVTNPPKGKPREVMRSEDIRRVIEARELIAQHELSLGELIDCNAGWIETSVDGLWEGLEDEEVELRQRANGP